MRNIINLTKMSLKNLNAIKKFAMISIFAVVVAVLFVSEGTKNMNGADANSIYLLMIINLMAYIFTYMVMSYEEMSNIDILIGYLPVEKKEYIQSRYLLGLAGVLLGVVLFFVVIFARNIAKTGSIVGTMGMNGILELAGMGIFCAILTISIIIPSHIGFGGTKGRLDLLTEETEKYFVSINKSDFGFEGLTNDYNGLFELLGEEAVYSRPKIEDILKFYIRG